MKGAFEFVGNKNTLRMRILLMFYC